jgi:hypothetical protein
MISRVTTIAIVLMLLLALHPVVLQAKTIVGPDEVTEQDYNFFIRFPWNGTMGMHGFKEALVSSDCKTVVTVSDAVLRIYDIREGYGTYSGGVRNYNGVWSSVAFSPDSSKLVAIKDGMSEKAKVYVFDVAAKSVDLLFTEQPDWYVIQLAKWVDDNTVVVTVYGEGLQQYTSTLSGEVTKLEEMSQELSEHAIGFFQTCAGVN